MSHPATSPTPTPPTTATTKSTEASSSEKPSPTAAATATRNRISAELSLTRLSPSISVTIRRGAPSLGGRSPGRERVRWRHDGPERKGRRPGKPSISAWAATATAEVEDHEADRDHRDAARVGPQLAKVGEERRHVQEGRQEQDEHELRIELHVRDPGDEADRKAAQHQQDRVGDAEQPGQHAERRDRHQQAEKKQLRVVHRLKTASAARPGPTPPSGALPRRRRAAGAEPLLRSSEPARPARRNPPRPSGGSSP